VLEAGLELVAVARAAGEEPEDGMLDRHVTPVDSRRP
jgi:hypothetical protein